MLGLPAQEGTLDMAAESATISTSLLGPVHPIVPPPHLPLCSEKPHQQCNVPPEAPATWCVGSEAQH